MFELFIKSDGNFIDTANNYTNGTSEKLIGEFTKSDREHFVLATKYTLTERKADPNFGGNHRKNMIRSVEGSLQRLNTDYIDLLYLHMWDFVTPIEEVMRALDDLVRSGKVLYIGMSDTPAWVVSQANTLADLRGWSRLVALQAPYSLADRALERDLMPIASAHEMSVLPWGVFEGRELTGKYNFPNDEPKRSSDASEKTKKMASVVMDIANEESCTPSQVAINWVRQQSPNIIPIIGARSEAHLKDNLGCLDFELTAEQIQRLNDSSLVDLGFPHSFLSSDHVRGLIFGETFSKLVV